MREDLRSESFALDFYFFSLYYWYDLDNRSKSSDTVSLPKEQTTNNGKIVIGSASGHTANDGGGLVSVAAIYKNELFRGDAGAKAPASNLEFFCVLAVT